MDKSTIKRLIPDEVDAEGATGEETVRLHLERYRRAAGNFRSGDHVLDMACDVGYGSIRLAEAVSHFGMVTGVDIEPSAIAYAQEHYANPNINFYCADAFVFGNPEAYDLVVSLETIEHISDPGRLVRHLASLVKPGGALVASVPITPSVDANPHHVTDFTLASFRKLLASADLRERVSLFGKTIRLRAGVIVLFFSWQPNPAIRA